MRSRRCTRGNARNENGYSLMEVLVVVALIIIISGVALFQWQNYLPTLRANAAMGQVIQQMRLARSTAVSDRRAIIVNISAGAGTMQLQQVPPGGGLPVTLSTVSLSGGAKFCLVPGLPDTPMAFGNSQPVNFVNATVPGAVVTVTEFLSDGTFGQAVGIPVNGSIFICAQGGQQVGARAITILGTTGRVRPYRWVGNSWQE
jgi:type II secretory pathway pseudopilin PulG